MDATRIIAKHVSADRIYGFDFSRQILSGTETLSGAPTATVNPTGELSLGAPSINSSTFTDTDNVKTIDANEGVLMQLSGGVAGSTYEVTITVDVSGGSEKVAETFQVCVYDSN